MDLGVMQFADGLQAFADQAGNYATLKATGVWEWIDRVDSLVGLGGGAFGLFAFFFAGRNRNTGVATSPVATADAARDGAVKGPGNFYFSFRGRINRKDYFLKWVLPFAVIYAVLLGIASQFDPEANSDSPFFAILGIFFLVLVWPSLATGFKRFHDTGLSGWWFILINVLFAVGQVYIETNFHEGQESFDVAAGVYGLANILLLLFLLFWPGTRGENKYGPDPRAK